MTEERPADIEIGATVKAKKLRFTRKPKVRVSPPGRSERKNLPDEVEPGVTYRDVEVRWRTEGRVSDERPTS